MADYLEGVQDWLRREFDIDEGPLPRDIAMLLDQLRGVSFGGDEPAAAPPQRFESYVEPRQAVPSLQGR